MNYRAIFMGSDDFSVPILERLISAGPGLSEPVETVAAVTQPDRQAGRGRRLVTGPVKALAQESDVAVLQPTRVRDPAALAEIAGYQPDLIVVAAYGQLLPKALLDMPPRGCLNLHPSLLPRHRGPSPVVGTLLAGDKMTGTTLMLVTPPMDAGPIISQVRTPVRDEETGGELEQRLAEMSADLLTRNLPAWLRGELELLEQDDGQATYTSKVTKQDGRIDWNEPASLLARRVRAYNPWPAAYTSWGERQLQLLWARNLEGTGKPGEVLGLDAGRLLIATGEGVLAADLLRLAGGRPLAAADLVRGHQALLTAHLV